MNMALLAADLSLGGGPATTSVKEGGSVVVRHRSEKQQLLYPLSSCDLHALEVYHKALEDERLKIQAFQRELPFCMQLLEDGGFFSITLANYSSLISSHLILITSSSFRAVYHP